MTKTYEINVPSGKYSIDQSDDLIPHIYHAFEYFVDNFFTRDDHQYLANLVKNDEFDVFNLVTIIE